MNFKKILLEASKEDKKKKDRAERERKWKEKVKADKAKASAAPVPKSSTPPKQAPKKPAAPPTGTQLPKPPSLSMPASMKPSVKMPTMPSFDIPKFEPKPTGSVTPEPPALGPSAPMPSLSTLAAEPEGGEEVDIKSLGTPSPTKAKRKKRPAKSGPKMPSMSAMTKGMSGDHKPPPPVDVPAFYKAGLKSQSSGPKWRTGDTVNMGKAGFAKVTDKIGNRFYLQKSDGREYVFVSGGWGKSGLYRLGGKKD